MVERLKHAIEKARAQRLAEEPPAVAQAQAERQPGDTARQAATPSDQLWSSLLDANLNPALLTRSRIVTHDKSDPAHIAFDLLRTRLIKVFRDNGWKRVAVTSPTKGCGKTLVCTNLAFSFARQPDLKTVLFDMDLKAPEVSSILGLRSVKPLTWFLTGSSPLEKALVRHGDNLAIGANGERVRDSTELISGDKAGKVLESAVSRLAPDAVIYDLPPMLVSDDAVASFALVDCVLLVVAAGQTTAKEIEECERLMAGQTNFLGVLLNKADENRSREGYEYS
ncbi:MAG: CpsD/CapB family tyrosine-protein kinase [Paracoccaceae bacterium]